MNRLLPVIFALLLLAPAAWAVNEPCVNNGDMSWRSPTTGSWTGCTADADDDFTISSGVTSIDGDLALTANASIRVTGTATVYIFGRKLIQFGDDFTVDSANAKVVIGGQKIFECAITSEPDITAANTLSIVLANCPMAQLAALDWIRVKHPFESLGYPAGKDLSKVAIHRGPGPALPGELRFEGAEEKIYRVRAVNDATKTITLYEDYGLEAGGGASSIYATAGSAPYAGTRGFPITTPASTATLCGAAGLTGCALTQDGRQTIITTLGPLTTLEGDFSRMYFTLTETGSTGSCAGNRYKVRWLDDNGANDTLIVDGVLNTCVGTYVYELNDGIGRGTVVEGWQMPVFSGDSNGDFVGGDGGAPPRGNIVLTAGTIQGEGAIFTYLGYIFSTTVSPSVAANSGFLIAEASAGVEPTGTLSKFAVLYSECPNGTTAAVYSSSVVNGTATERFLGSSVRGLLKLRHGYIADSRNNTTSGCVGRMLHHASADDQFMRYERNSDNGIESLQGLSNGTNFAATSARPQIRMSNLDIYEHISASDSTQSGFKFWVQGVDADGTLGNGNHQYMSFADSSWLKVTDVTAIGASRPLEISGLGARVDGLVTSSTQAYDPLKIRIVPNLPNGQISATNATPRRNLISNFDIGLLGGGAVGATDVQAYLSTRLHYGWLWGQNETGSSDQRMTFVSGVKGVAYVCPTTAAGSRVWDGPSAAGEGSNDTLDFYSIDTLITCPSGGAKNVGHMSYQWDFLRSYTVFRTLFFGRWNSNVTGHEAVFGAITSGDTPLPNVLWLVNGFAFLSDTPQPDLAQGMSFTSPTSGSYVRNSVMVTTQARSGAYLGLEDSSDSVLAYGIGKTGSDKYTLPEFIQAPNENATGLRSAYPRTIGPQRRSISFVNEGDGVNAQPQLWTSALWGSSVGGGGGSRGVPSTD